MRTVLNQRRCAIVAATLVAGLLLAACSPSSGVRSDGRMSVVASFYPLAEAAARVGGPDVHVENLTQPGVEPHDLELTTRQVDDVLDADVVLVLGGRFQPAVEDLAVRRHDGVTAVVLDALDLRAGPDPHVWLSPVQMRRIVDVVAGALAEASPADRAAIERRAARYGDELTRLDTRYRNGLASCRTRTIVTSHAAFGWLARAYDLEELSISGLAPEQEPDPRRLATLADVARRRGVTTVFTEALVSPEVARTLAREAGLRTAVLDPLEGLSKRRIAAGADYVGVMDANLARLRTALGCR